MNIPEVEREQFQVPEGVYESPRFGGPRTFGDGEAIPVCAFCKLVGTSKTAHAADCCNLFPAVASTALGLGIGRFGTALRISGVTLPGFYFSAPYVRPLPRASRPNGQLIPYGVSPDSCLFCASLAFEDSHSALDCPLVEELAHLLRTDDSFRVISDFDTLEWQQLPSPFDDIVRGWPATDPSLHPFPSGYHTGPPRPSHAVIEPLPRCLSRNVLITPPFCISSRPPGGRFSPCVNPHEAYPPLPRSLYELRGDINRPLRLANVPVTSRRDSDITIDLAPGEDFPFCAYCAQSSVYPVLHPTLKCPRLRSALSYIDDPFWVNHVDIEETVLRPIVLTGLDIEVPRCFYCQKAGGVYVNSSCNLQTHRNHHWESCPAHPYARQVLRERSHDNYPSATEWYVRGTIPVHPIVQISIAHLFTHDRRQEIALRSGF